MLAHKWINTLDAGETVTVHCQHPDGEVTLLFITLFVDGNICVVFMANKTPGFIVYYTIHFTLHKCITFWPQ